MDVNGINVPTDTIEMESSIEPGQVWARNWRQFTSILPGLLLLLTIGMHNVSTIYECYQCGAHPKLLNDPISFNEISRSHSWFENQNNQNSYEPMRRYKRSYDEYGIDYDNYDDLTNEVVRTTIEDVYIDHGVGEVISTSATDEDNTTRSTESTIIRDRTAPNEIDKNAMEEMKPSTSTVASHCDDFEYDNNYDEANKEVVDPKTAAVSRNVAPPYWSGQRSTSTDRNELASMDNDYKEVIATTAADEDSNWSAERSTRDPMYGIFVWTAPNKTDQNPSTRTVAPHVNNIEYDDRDYVVEEVRPTMDTYGLDENIPYGKTSTHRSHIHIGLSTDRVSHFDRPAGSKFIFVIMWFCGAIFGNLYGAILVCGYKKRTIYYIAAIFQIVAGILFFLARDVHDDFPFSGLVNYTKTIFSTFMLDTTARFVSGIACGIAHLTVTVHASEIASKRMRQIISFAIVIVMAFSSLFYATEERILSQSFVKEKSLFGFDLIAVGILTMIVIPLFTNESVPYYLARGKVAKAQKKFSKLRNEQEPSTDTLRKFDAVRAVVREDMENGKNIFGGGNFKPLCTVMSARLLHLLVLNTPWTMSTLSCAKSIAMQIPVYDVRFITQLYASRIIIGTIVLAVAARLGRQLFYYVSVIVFGVFIAAFLTSSLPGMGQVLLYTLSISFAYLSLGLDYYQQKQCLEAFAITKTAWSLATIGILENVVHAALFTASIFVQPEMIIFAGVGILGLSSILLVIRPGTPQSPTPDNGHKIGKLETTAISTAV